MEVITGKKPTDEMFAGSTSLKDWIMNKNQNNSEMADVVDDNLINPEEEEKGNSSLKMQCSESILDLALKCSAELPEERIKIADVLTLLKKIRYRLLNSY